MRTHERAAGGRGDPLRALGPPRRHGPTLSASRNLHCCPTAGDDCAGDAVRRTGHLVTLRCTLGLTLYFACEAVGLFASFVLWVANALWLGATADRVVTWNPLLQRVWARTLFTGATRLFTMRTEVTGEEAVRYGPLFLFCRHASTLDTLLPAVCASQPCTLRLGHLMKRELLWDPCLDIVGQRTRNAFVRVCQLATGASRVGFEDHSASELAAAGRRNA